MKQSAAYLVLALGAGTAYAQFPPQIKNVIVVVQENRTPDNLFHFLSPTCPIPAGASGLKACTPYPVTSKCYNISPCGLSNEVDAADPVPVMLAPVNLAYLKGQGVDPDHSHAGFVNMCDPDPVTFACRNDGAWKTTKPAGAAYGYVDNTPATNTDGSAGHLLDPYLTLAEQYGWANFMYQTNQGPSYPAHQFLFSGTSAPTATDDTVNATFVSGNFDSKTIGGLAGCLLPTGATNHMISPSPTGAAGANCTEYPGNVQECQVSNVINGNVGTYCYSHESVVDLLNPRGITWKYYATSIGSIWDAPDSFQAICQPVYMGSGDPTCTGPAFQAGGNVDVANHSGDVLNDIANCKLANVSWVTPDGLWSDHPTDDPYGPSWVAAIVNAIGNSKGCGPSGETYWQNTAIVVTWDDWGGWSDNQPAPYASSLPCSSLVSTPCEGDYQYGFRVPLLVVSAYTPAHYINNVPHDFGSIVRFIEGVNGIKEGELGFADTRAESDLRLFFSLTTPRTYQTIASPIPASYFQTFSGKSSPPDTD